MAFFFILKVEEETAEAAETDAEGTRCMVPDWDGVRQGWGENPASPLLLAGSRELTSLQPAGPVRAVHRAKHPVGTAQWQYWHCLELALNVQCLVLLIQQSLM